MKEKIDFLKRQLLTFVDKNSTILNVGNLSNEYKQAYSELSKEIISIDSYDQTIDTKLVNVINFNSNIHTVNQFKDIINSNKPLLIFENKNIINEYHILNEMGYYIYDISPINNISSAVGPLTYDEFIYYKDKVCNGNFLGVYKENIKKYNLSTTITGKTCGVIFGRNDGYKEKERFLIHLTTMLDTFDEVIYVDWNSSKHSFLYEVIKDVPKLGKLKHIVIPPTVCNILNEYNQNLISSCNASLAFNIALRRTDAEYITITTTDIIPPSRNILENFIKKTNKHSFYTLSRRDIDYADVVKYQNNLYEFINYLNETTQPRYFPARVTQNDNYSIFNCCGDFQFASKNVWLKVKGYEEKMIYACFGDTNVQKKSVLYGFDLIPVYDVPLYHMSHTGMANDGTSPSKKFYNDANEWVEHFNKYTEYSYQFISKNSDTWGISDVEIEHEII